jgi:uncharacterized protein YjbI with pentapeptide repeats
MKPMTNELRKKILMRIKNRIDISDLVEGIDLKGENLSGAIISVFNRPESDFTKTNFSRAIIGADGTMTNISGSDLTDTNLNHTVFKGKLLLRRCKCLRTVFAYTYWPHAEYQHTDFRGSHFCETIMTFGSRCGLGAKFSREIFDDLIKYWEVEGVRTMDDVKREVGDGFGTTEQKAD